MGYKRRIDSKLSFMSNAFFTFKVAWGRIKIEFSRKGIRHLILPEEDKDDIYKKSFIPAANSRFLKIKSEIERYFLGCRINFDSFLDIEEHSDFQKNVWMITREIPWGEVRSYKWIAEKSGKKCYRAVGLALRANPVPLIIPCHRVLKSDGRLGGFALGTEYKRRLLELEKVEIK